MGTFCKHSLVVHVFLPRKITKSAKTNGQHKKIPAQVPISLCN